MSKIIGIDFGTTNSLAAFTFDGKTRIITIEDEDGVVESLIPSVICKLNGDLIVGRKAKDNASAFTNGDGIAEIKTKIGSGEKIYFAGDYYEPFEISAIILKKIKRNAEIELGGKITEAVITVPAEFSDAQRKEIIKAGENAGLSVKKIINEPTAALLAYAENNIIGSKKIACYDFGGGTFDISLAHIKGNSFTGKSVSIIGVGGDKELGGSDIDTLLYKFCEEKIYARTFKRLSTLGKRNLRIACEKAKIRLSSERSTVISADSIHFEDGTVEGFFQPLSQQDFEQMITPIVSKTVELVRSTFEHNEMHSSDVDLVLLVGGSSKIPLVSKMLKQKLGLKTTFGNINPDECVAIGASIEAANISGQTWKRNAVKIKQDVSPFTFGLKYDDNRSKGLFDPLIRKNFPYGKEYSEEYSTALDYQNSMKLEIYQGESSYAYNNEFVTNFEIKGIPERKAGEERVKVYFIYDENGVLTVRARIMSTGQIVANTFKTDNSKYQNKSALDKVNEHFIDEQKVEKALNIARNAEASGYSTESNKIINAIRVENENTLDDLIDDLLS